MADICVTNISQKNTWQFCVSESRIIFLSPRIPATPYYTPMAIQKCVFFIDNLS
jgi:hypothetical protein